MIISKTLVFVIAVLLVIFLISWIMKSNGPLRIRDERDLVGSDGQPGIQMVVEGYDDRDILSAANLGEWEVMDENWKDPTYYTSDVKFEHGRVDILVPGVYQISADLAILLINDSFEDITANVDLRIIKGHINHRYEYHASQVACLDSRSIRLPAKSKITRLINCTATVDISREDVSDLSGSVAPQYMVNVSDEDIRKMLDARRLTIDRNPKGMPSKIIVTRIV